MRHSHFYLFGFAALVAACQPVTPTTVNNKAVPTVTIVPEGQTEIDLVVSTVTKTVDNEVGTESGSESSLGSNNSTEDTVIAAIPATPPIQPPFRPNAMIGSASDILLHDLGIANMIRQEGPIEIWQYRFAECVVDFFFYPTSQGSSQLVIKEWDMRSAVIGGRVNKRKCIAAMDRNHQKLVAGS
jgi:hypothetical protein